MRGKQLGLSMTLTLGPLDRPDPTAGPREPMHCKVCQREFKTKDGMDRHIATKHRGVSATPATPTKPGASQINGSLDSDHKRMSF